MHRACTNTAPQPTHDAVIAPLACMARADARLISAACLMAMDGFRLQARPRRSHRFGLAQPRTAKLNGAPKAARMPLQPPLFPSAHDCATCSSPHEAAKSSSTLNVVCGAHHCAIASRMSPSCAATYVSRSTPTPRAMQLPNSRPHSSKLPHA